MEIVKLKPETKRLKQLIKEFGSEWVVIRRKDKVQCFDNTPGLLVVSKDNKHTRWVKPSHLEV